MSELISGKEAWIAYFDNTEVQYLNNGSWYSMNDDFNDFSLCDFQKNEIKFRLKPRTITINGVEVPACGTNYKPHTFMFVLNSLEPCEYSKIILDESDEIPPYWWQTEDEIKQVVAALRSIFNVK